MGKNVRQIVSEELSRIFEDDFDFAAAEREYHDNEEYQAQEAQISSALSFMQDMVSSRNKLEAQLELSGTGPEVDQHIEQGIKSISLAMQLYLEKLSPEVKSEMSQRMREIDI